MKTIKFLKLIMIVFVTITVASCVDSDEYDVPPVANQVEPNVTVNSSIQAVKSALEQHFISDDESKMTFDGDSNVVFSGYVVSSDYAGNFFESIVVQDSPSNPTHGIEILIDKSSLFENYEVGRKIYVKMAGLSVSYEDGDDNDPTDTDVLGRYSIGVDAGGFGLDEVPLYSYLTSILRSTEVATIVPTVITSDDITEDHINTFVQLSDMQFDINEIGKTFSGEANDSFDGFRNLISCADDTTVTLQTSTFADFSSYTVPEQVGNMNAVLMKDFRADFLVFVINSPTDLEFSSSDRCDPVILDCGTNAVGGTQVLFDEDFEGTSETQLTTDGWLNVNANGGSTDYSLRSFSGNSYMQVGAFRTGENPLEVWLVTPAIDLDTTTDEELTFETKVGFYNGDALSVLVSTDFTGDVNTATWALVGADLADSPTSGYGSSFTESGSVNISCLDGDVYVAFRYLGADSGITTTFQVENVKVTGN